MGGVFAETSVGGYTRGKVTFGQGETGKDSKAKGEASARIALKGQNEEGTFGGEFRFGSDTWAGSNAFLKDGRSNVWWKPLDMLKIYLGPPSLDGSWGLSDAVTGWGFTEGYKDWGMQDFGGYGFGDRGGNMGLFLEVKPISGLEFDLILPFNTETDVLNVYKKFYARVVYDIPNIGQVQAAFQSDLFKFNGVDDAKLAAGNFDEGIKRDTGKLGLSFDLSALNAMGLKLGFMLQTGLPTANGDLGITRTEPLKVDFGAGFTAGDFTVRFRSYGQFLGKTVITTATGETTVKDFSRIGFGLFPFYKVSGNLTVGVGFDAKVENITEEEWWTTGSTVYWHTSPFVQYAVGPGKFQIGLDVGTNSKADPDVLAWRIPIFVNFGF